MTHHKGGPNDNAEPEIVKEFEELDAAVDAILERLGGPLTKEQKESLKNLVRLDHALGGPDAKLDSELYSRPFTPIKFSTSGQ